MSGWEGERKKWGVSDDGSINGIRGQGWLLPNKLCLCKIGNSTVWMSMSKSERETGMLSRDMEHSGAESCRSPRGPPHSVSTLSSRPLGLFCLQQVACRTDWSHLMWFCPFLLFSSLLISLTSSPPLRFISTSPFPSSGPLFLQYQTQKSVCGWALECAKIVICRKCQVGLWPRGCLKTTAHSRESI